MVINSMVTVCESNFLTRGGYKILAAIFFGGGPNILPGRMHRGLGTVDPSQRGLGRSPSRGPGDRVPGQGRVWGALFGGGGGVFPPGEAGPKAKRGPAAKNFFWVLISAIVKMLLS